MHEDPLLPEQIIINGKNAQRPLFFGAQYDKWGKCTKTPFTRAGYTK